MFTEKELASLMHDLVEATDHQRIKMGRRWATLEETFYDYLDEVGGMSSDEIEQVLEEIKIQEAV